VLGIIEAVETSPARVLYVAGTGHSGTTLLERLLGETPGVAPLGEVIDLWWRGVMRNERCGCGTPFLDCPFWSEVGKEAFGGWEHVDAPALRATQDRLVRHVNSAMFGRGLAGGGGAGTDQLVDALARLYGAIAAVSGASVLVDTSKRVPYASLLGRAGVNVSALNLVRDPRAVVYSLSRRVTRPHVADGSVDYMHTQRVPVAAVEWIVFNEAIRVLARNRTPVLRVRYEDLVRDPNTVVPAVLRHAGLDVAEATAPQLDQGTVEFSVTHGLAGNPIRFDRGPVGLRIDESWKVEMRRPDRMLTTIITAPLLARYGYAGLRRSRPGADAAPRAPRGKWWSTIPPNPTDSLTTGVSGSPVR
jgi:hypothetical protein